MVGEAPVATTLRHGHSRVYLASVIVYEDMITIVFHGDVRDVRGNKWNQVSILL